MNVLFTLDSQTIEKKDLLFTSIRTSFINLNVYENRISENTIIYEEQEYKTYTQKVANTFNNLTIYRCLNVELFYINMFFSMQVVSK